MSALWAAGVMANIIALRLDAILSTSIPKSPPLFAKFFYCKHPPSYFITPFCEKSNPRQDYGRCLCESGEKETGGAALRPARRTAVLLLRRHHSAPTWSPNWVPASSRVSIDACHHARV